MTYQDAAQSYVAAQSQAWRQPLAANDAAARREQGRLSHCDAIIKDPRSRFDVGVQTGETTAIWKYRELGGNTDRSDGRISAKEFKRLLDEAKARSEGKPKADRADGYRRDAFDFSRADVWEQGGFIVAVNDGVMVKWRRKDAPAEVLARL